MKFSVTNQQLAKIDAHTLVIHVFENASMTTELPEPITDQIKDIIGKEFKPKLLEHKIVSTLGLMKAKQILLVGLGHQENFTLEKLRQVMAYTGRYLRNTRVTNFATLIHYAWKDLEEAGHMVTEAAIMGSYQFVKYKSGDIEKVLDKITFYAENKEDGEAIATGARKGLITGAAVNYTRELVNEPASVVTPNYLANEAKQIGKNKYTSVKIYGKSELKKMGANGILAVNAGSMEEPKLIHLFYKPLKNGPSVALVGKGITFDSGGLDLKGASGMIDMKYDMAGGAAVLGALKAVMDLNLKINVHCIIGATENMPGHQAYKPGDVITIMNGKTVEVANTDAEGRIVLADALTFAGKLKPDNTIDLATLTGAAMIALGNYASCLFGNDRKLRIHLRKAGNLTGDRAWPLPLWEDYDELIKSDIADVRNVGRTRAGGAITAAAFLKKFVTGNWAHLDIAGTAWWEEDNGYNMRGATGAGVRILVQYLRMKASEYAKNGKK